jgi:hypothetical protein
MNASGFKDYVTDAIKFWERWRLAYNLVLAAIVIIHFAAGYPASKAILTLDSLWVFSCWRSWPTSHTAQPTSRISSLKPPASANSGNDIAGSSLRSEPPLPPSLLTSLPRAYSIPSKNFDMRRTEPQPRFVVCVNNKDYPASLELRKLYQVIADEAAAKHHQIRVIDESGEDYLYPEEYFVPVQLPQAAEKAVLRAANLTSAK